MLIITEWTNLMVNLPLVVTKECVVTNLVEKLQLTRLISYLFRFTRYMKSILSLSINPESVDELLAHLLWSL